MREGWGLGERERGRGKKEGGERAREREKHTKMLSSDYTERLNCE